jgi:phenylalanyl-tRNA synthetase beta chain
LVGAESVGVFGELHPKTVQTLEFGERALLVADLDLDRILKAVPFRYPYAPIPVYQAALRDIAVVVEESISSEQIVAELRAGGGEMLTEVRLFDLYHGDQVPAGCKSLAYALTYQATDKTLTEKEIEKVHKKVEDRVRQVLKAKIRGKDL